jgi:hypothetical protein
VHVVAGVGERDAGTAIHAAAVHEQRLVAVVERGPLDLVLIEV